MRTTLQKARVGATDGCEVIRQLKTFCLFGIFEASDGIKSTNDSHMKISRLLFQAQRLRRVSWHVTVVVTSDDPAFLTAFANITYNSSLLVAETKLLAVTRLPLSQLDSLQKTFSLKNAMLLVNSNSNTLRSSLYIYLPYSAPCSPAVKVADWTPQRGLVLTSHLPLFPHKFSKFAHKPNLRVVSVEFTSHNLVLLDDPEAPGKKRITFQGIMANVNDYIAQGLNFTYTYVRPDDASWGIKKADGTFSGMMGVMTTGGADIGLGPFGLTAVRYEVVDYTYPVDIASMKLLAGRGSAEVDPWNFLLSLAPLVWAATLVALLGLLALYYMFHACFSKDHHFMENASSLIRVFLQQDVDEPRGWWWWERVLLVMWAMVTLVLTRSYSGNLMALLAVKNIPQPFQSLRDVLDDSKKIMIWELNSFTVSFYREATSGIFTEVAAAERNGRVIFNRLSEYPDSIDRLVRAGSHVIFETESSLKTLMAQDFSLKGKCDFYYSREGFLSTVYGLIGPKYNPLVAAISRRLMRMSEFGLYDHWQKEMVPNSTTCLNLPTKIFISSTLTIHHLWVLFTIVVGGYVLCVVALCLELLAARLLPSTPLFLNNLMK
ncbi:glutamate receptor-like [Cherax quadricarinatus]|uniref:glutamate receptor-like n=1 Tax=Cherax quadricarinatus TaxID=27406 RepID=UPI00387E9F80